MNAMMRFALAAILAASAVPLTANAAGYSYFIPVGTFGNISGFIGYPNIGTVGINAVLDGSGKTSAKVLVEIHENSICYSGYGSTDNIQFTVTPSRNNPKVVTASGSVQVYLVNCSDGPDVTDNISFNMNIAAISNEVSYFMRTNTRYNTQNLKQLQMGEGTEWPALINGPTTITSNIFGPMIVESVATIFYGRAQRNVEIIKK